MLYVLTRTSGRPRLFATLRRSLAEQTVPYRHLVHSDTPTDTYAEGDVVIEGTALPIKGRHYGPEVYQARLLEALRDLIASGWPHGWVTFIDDDDRYVSRDSLATIAGYCTDPGVMPVWRIKREGGRIAPEAGLHRATWEVAAFHTTHIPAALQYIEPVGGNDGDFWRALSTFLRVEHHPALLIEPQLPGRLAKGRGARVDAPVITVAIPVLGRPHRIKVIADKFTDRRLFVLFLPDPTDEASIAELERLDLTFSFAHDAPDYGVPTYASKINHAYLATDTPFLLYAADDITPGRDWVTRALRRLEDQSVGLLGTNDQAHHLVRKGLLATHGIVRRSYVEEHGTASLPGSGPVMHEGYRHWNVDVEVTWVARQRGAYKYAPDVLLRHDKHRIPQARDSTYAIGAAHADTDRALRAERIPGWPHGS